MMQLPVLISLIVLGGIIAAATGVELLHNREELEELPPLLEPSLTISTPDTQTDIFQINPTPAASTVSGATYPSPTSLRHMPIPPTQPTPEQTPTAEARTDNVLSEPLGITFINLPESVSAGERFTVRWRITGPQGAAGSDAMLVVLYEAAETENGSEASSRSKTSQTFGSFTTPAEFDASFSFGDMPADVELTATAKVAGKTLQERRIVKLKP